MAPGGEPATLRLTWPGALLVALVPTVLGGLLDGVFGVGYGNLTRIGFVAGCVVAALRVRTRDLAPLAVTPPLVFVVGVTVVETVRSWGGNWVRNEVVAVTMALAGAPRWVAAGTVATVLIAGGRTLLPRFSRRRAGRRRQPRNPAGQQSASDATPRH